MNKGKKRRCKQVGPTPQYVRAQNNRFAMLSQLDADKLQCRQAL